MHLAGHADVNVVFAAREADEQLGALGVVVDFADRGGLDVHGGVSQVGSALNAWPTGHGSQIHVICEGLLKLTATGVTVGEI